MAYMSVFMWMLTVDGGSAQSGQDRLIRTTIIAQAARWSYGCYLLPSTLNAKTFVNAAEQSRVSREITNSVKCQNTLLSSCQGLQLPISISRTWTQSKLHQFTMKPEAEVGL